MRANTEADFWERFIPEPNSGCWIWLGTIEVSGYGMFPFQGKQWKAHRLAYIFAKGTIPGDLDACHKCDVPCCVNPDHIFLGTHQDNMDDRDRKGRHGARKLAGDRSPNARLSWETVKLIRSSTLSSRLLGQQLGVCRSTIKNVRRGKTWRQQCAS
jgi:hypothetical protein